MEQWLSVVGAPMYEVSDLGRVRRALPGGSNAAVIGHILRQHIDEDGYPLVILFPEIGTGRRQKKLVHRLMLEAFRGPCPKGKVGTHFDGKPANNILSNLAWRTILENVHDKFRHGTMAHSERSGRGKLIRAQVLEILDALPLKRGDRTRLAKRFAVSPQAIGHIAAGRNWKYARSN